LKKTGIAKEKQDLHLTGKFEMKKITTKTGQEKNKIATTDTLILEKLEQVLR